MVPKVLPKGASKIRYGQTDICIHRHEGRGSAEGESATQDLPLGNVSEGQKVGCELRLNTKLDGAVKHESVGTALIVIHVVEDIESRDRRDNPCINISEPLGIWARAELRSVRSRQRKNHRAYKDRTRTRQGARIGSHSQRHTTSAHGVTPDLQ